MTEPCCHRLKTTSRTRRDDQPEAEKRDACFEYDPRLGIYYVADNTGQFTLPIEYCPWCATHLPPKPEIQALIDALDAGGFVGVIKVEVSPQV
jgi:hypothetical protein